MSDNESSTPYKPILLVLLLLLSVWQMYTCYAGSSLVTAPSDLGFISLGIRSALVFAWVLILYFTPTSAGVFIPLFLGFSSMALATGTEWMLLIRKVDDFMLSLYDVERIFSAVMVTIGVAVWSMERRKEDVSSRTLSATDSLTGIYNTRYFYQELENEIRRVRRYGRELALVLIRVDHLREYNDKHGYGEGDRVLKDMGQSILGYLRRSDMGCRFGANEFAILLPETPTGGAALVGQRLQDRLHDLEFVVGADHHRMSLTVAVVQLKEEEASLGLVRRAEKLLEEAPSRAAAWSSKIEIG